MSEVFFKLIKRQVTVTDKQWFVKCRTCDFVFELPPEKNLQFRYGEKLPSEKKLEDSHGVTCPNCHDHWQIFIDCNGPTQSIGEHFVECPNCLGQWTVKAKPEKHPSGYGPPAKWKGKAPHPFFESGE
jgi:Zn finger protein HypA/HybF involved in hydrogenase expression